MNKSRYKGGGWGENGSSWEGQKNQFSGSSHVQGVGTKKKYPEWAQFVSVQASPLQQTAHRAHIALPQCPITPSLVKYTKTHDSTFVSVISWQRVTPWEMCAERAKKSHTRMKLFSSGEFRQRSDAPFGPCGDESRTKRLCVVRRH